MAKKTMFGNRSKWQIPMIEANCFNSSTNYSCLLLLVGLTILAMGLVLPAKADFYSFWAGRPAYSGGYSESGAFAYGRR